MSKDCGRVTSYNTQHLRRWHCVPDCTNERHAREREIERKVHMNEMTTGEAFDAYRQIEREGLEE